jgi:hypothetical protein
VLINKHVLARLRLECTSEHEVLLKWLIMPCSNVQPIWTDLFDKLHYEIKPFSMKLLWKFVLKSLSLVRHVLFYFQTAVTSQNLWHSFRHLRIRAVRLVKWVCTCVLTSETSREKLLTYINEIEIFYSFTSICWYLPIWVQIVYCYIFRSVTIDGVRIRGRTYWPLIYITRNYK